MSTNIFNVMSPILIDTNRYVMSDLKIEFKKTFIKSETVMQPNQLYNFQAIPNTDNINLPVEISKYDSNSYIKLKNQDLWLHMDTNNNLFFDIIRQEDFYYRQPLSIWFYYNKDDEMVMQKYFGKGLAQINEVINGGFSNTRYIIYKQVGNDIYMSWTNDVMKATKIIIERIESSDYAWKTKVNLKTLTF